MTNERVKNKETIQSKVTAPSLQGRAGGESKSSGGESKSSGGESITVIKVGGAVVEDPAQLATLLDNFAAIPGPKVLVHGGGRTATALAAQLGIESRMVGGRRITDAQTLRVVTMVYAGLVNKNIVAQLQARGINALGLTGADLNLIRAHRRPVTHDGTDFGYVGDVDSADGQRLRQLLELGITPVIAPLTHDGHGNLLNTNPDTMAQTIATALASAQPNCPLSIVHSQSPSPTTPTALNDKPSTLNESPSALNESPSPLNAKRTTLTFCFELPGVLRDPADPTTLIPRITEAQLSALIADGTVSGGMIPKLQNAFAALHAGVATVRITNIHNLTAGTIIMLGEQDALM